MWKYASCRPNSLQARLNFGDRFACALALTRSAPLLYAGDDFRATDVTSAI